MGGKQKQVQRTKGNTRPSSSGRSAEKLMASGVPVAAGFSGFGTIQLQSEHLGLLKVKTSNAELDPLIDGDCRMLMKRMTKKDAITRLKALQEFQAVCMHCSDEALLGALPFWPRLFNKLCLDSDRRVREATHNANLQIVKRVKRNLAPHLRSMMGNWLMAQCDPHAPAASAAILAFQTAFVQEKQLEALVFCKEEILNAIADHLFHQTPQTLSDPEVTPIEEMEETYNRVVSSFLTAFELFLDQLSSNEHEKLLESYSRIVMEGKFWKYAKSQVPQVCRSWFRVIAIMCQMTPSILDTQLTRLCPTVLGRLDETDPVIVSSVWDAALHILVAFKNCWQHVNIQKAVLPRLWAILRKGCDGNASAICPYLLPFLSKLPIEAVGNPNCFYLELFTSFRQGLALSKVQNSFSECTALVVAYFECLKYVLAEVSREPQLAATALAEDLVICQLLPVVETSLLEPNSHLAFSTPIYALLNDILNHIHHQVLLSDSSSVTFQKIEKAFWDAFNHSCHSFLYDFTEPKAFSLSSLSSMFSAFVNKEHMPQLKRKPLGKVRFADSADFSSGASGVDFAKKSLLMLLGNPFVVDLKDPRVCCAFEFCSIGLQGFLSETSILHLKFVSEMTMTFASDDLFKVLLDTPGLQFSQIASVSESPAWRFYEEVILKWLQDGKCSNDEESVSYVTGLIIAVIRCSDGDERKLAVLNKLCDVKNIPVLEATLQILIPVRPQLEFVKRWTMGVNLNCTILKCTEILLDAVSSNRNEIVGLAEDQALWNVLSKCLVMSGNLEPILAPDSVGKILQVMQELLTSLMNRMTVVSVEVLGSICQLTSEFFENVPNCWTYPESEKLLLSFFKHGCKKLSVINSCTSSIEKVWITGVTSMITNQGEQLTSKNFLHAASRHVHDLIFLSDCPMDHLNVAVERATKLFRAILCAVPHVPDISARSFAHHSLLEDFLLFILPTDSEWNQMVENLCQNLLFGDALRGKLFFQCLPVLLECDRRSKCDAPLAASILAADMISELCQEMEKQSIVPDVNRFWPQFLGILNVMTYCGLAKEHIKNFNDQIDGEDLKYWNVVLDEKFKFLLRKFLALPGFELQLLDVTFQKAKMYGSLWAYSQRELVFIFKGCNLDVSVQKLIDFDSIMDSDAALHTLKLLIPFDKQLNLEFLSSVLSNEELLSSADAIESTKSIAIIQACLENLSVEDISDPLDIISKIMNVLLKWKESKDVYLFACQLPHQWAPISKNVEVAKLLATVTTRFYASLCSEHWDFILCSLGSWMQSCYESRTDFISPNLETQMFGIAMFQLAYSVASMLDGSAATNSAQPDGLPSNLLTEWQEFFATSIFSPLLQLFLDVASTCSTSPGLLLSTSYVLENLVSSLKWIPVDIIENNSLPPLLVAKWDENDSFTPIKVKTALNRLCPLLISCVRDIRLGAHAILLNLIPSLPKYAEKRARELDEMKEDIILIPGPLQAILVQANGIIEVLLSDFNIGDVCVVQPHTDSYSFTSGYLFAWSLILRLFSGLSAEMKSHYASYLRDSGLVESLIKNLFRLMPTDVSSLESSIYMPATQQKLSATSKPSNLFTEIPKLDPQSCTDSFELQHLACFLYFEALRQIPALIREWWNGADRRIANLVEKFTSKHVSPWLCSEDITAVQRTERKFRNMTVRARLTTREVVATYALDEIAFELTVKLADNHPLGAVNIDTGRRVGVSNPQWSYWLLQLTTFLMHQNGSILDGLVLWKRNIDKKFEGVEECYVCFYVFHGTTSQLPKLVCRTCKKKFHSSCLYKWFNTSGHSTCPLCRSIF